MDVETSFALLSLLPSVQPPHSTAISDSNRHLFCFKSLIQFANGINSSAISSSCQSTVKILKLSEHASALALEDILFQISFYFHRSHELSALTTDEILSCKSLPLDHKRVTSYSGHKISLCWRHEGIRHSLPITIPLLNR
jgi:hypothetical protein